MKSSSPNPSPQPKNRFFFGLHGLRAGWCIAIFFGIALPLRTAIRWRFLRAIRALDVADVCRRDSRDPGTPLSPRSFSRPSSIGHYAGLTVLARTKNSGNFTLH